MAYGLSAQGQVRQGFLHDAVGEDFGNLSQARIYVAGPPPMVDAFHASEPEKKSLWARVTGWGSR